mgnify:CR=1 FL=1
MKLLTASVKDEPTFIIRMEMLGVEASELCFIILKLSGGDCNSFLQRYEDIAIIL